MSVEPTLMISPRLMSCINNFNDFVFECGGVWMSVSMYVCQMYTSFEGREEV